MAIEDVAPSAADPAPAAEPEEPERPKRGRPKKRLGKKARPILLENAFYSRLDLPVTKENYQRFLNCNEEECRKNETEQARLNMMTEEERKEEKLQKRLARLNKRRGEG